MHMRMRMQMHIFMWLLMRLWMCVNAHEHAHAPSALRAIIMIGERYYKQHARNECNAANGRALTACLLGYVVTCSKNDDDAVSSHLCLLVDYNAKPGIALSHAHANVVEQ